MAKRVAAYLPFALLLVACGERPLEPRAPTPGVPHYRFVTYNVHFPEAGDTRTISAIRAAGADVVCLQETDDSWRAALEDELSVEYPHRSFVPLAGAAGLAVLSRYPISETRVVSRADGFRPAWLGTVETPSGPIELLDVHLRAAFDGSGDPLDSLLETGADHRSDVRAYLAEFSSEVPRLILGDFNEDPDGHALSWLEGSGFRNALPLYHPGQPTWFGTSLAKQLALTLDHILFDGSFAPLDSYVLDRGGSDHIPVVAHLEIPSRGESP
jgi:endonuclease/exonuclease/phosphatase family metal-dependent hydrolase